MAIPKEICQNRVDTVLKLTCCSSNRLRRMSVVMRSLGSSGVKNRVAYLKSGKLKKCNTIYKVI